MAGEGRMVASDVPLLSSPYAKYNSDNIKLEHPMALKLGTWLLVRYCTAPTEFFPSLFSKLLTI